MTTSHTGNDGSIAILIFIIAGFVIYGLLYNLEGICKLVAAFQADREIARLRQERMALLFERRIERNAIRLVRAMETRSNAGGGDS